MSSWLFDYVGRRAKLDARRGQGNARPISLRCLPPRSDHLLEAIPGFRCCVPKRRHRRPIGRPETRWEATRWRLPAMGHTPHRGALMAVADRGVVRRFRDRRRNDLLRRRCAILLGGQRAALTVVAPLRCASIFAMPTHIRHGRSGCPVARSLDVLGDKWTLLIIRDALSGTTRFSDFHRHLPA